MNQNGQNRPHYGGLRRAMEGLSQHEKLNYAIDQIDRARGQRDFYHEKLDEANGTIERLRALEEDSGRVRESLTTANERIGRRNRTIDRLNRELAQERSRAVLAERQLAEKQRIEEGFREEVREKEEESVDRVKLFVEILNELMEDWDIGVKYELDWEEGKDWNVRFEPVMGKRAGTPIWEELPESEYDEEEEELPLSGED